MPIEYTLLKDAPVPIPACPKCGAMPFDPFMRGQVQRSRFSFAYIKSLWNGEPFKYCALICWRCKEIVGYESPENK